VTPEDVTAGWKQFMENFSRWYDRSERERQSRQPPPKRQPEPPVPFATIATLAWLLGVATSEAMGIASTATVER